MNNHPTETEPHSPSLLSTLLEARAPLEALAGLATWPLLKKCPQGDGHPVMVIPGLLASDGSTFPLRAHLKRLGYRVQGWGLGRNLGPRSGAVEQALDDKLTELARESGGKVSLVGQSLGGVFARILAFRRPELVRMVVTLGSPVEGHPHSNNAWRVYQYFNGIFGPEDDTRWAQVVALPKVPSVSICSRSDGVVDWSSSRSKQGPASENIEILGSHMGMAAHPAVLIALADRLALAPGQWHRFEPSGAIRWLFPHYRDDLK